jgi:hypothetical protein
MFSWVLRLTSARFGFFPGAVNDPLEYAEQFGQVREQVSFFVNDDFRKK